MSLRAIDGVKTMPRFGLCFVYWIDDSIGSSLAGLHLLHAGQGLCESAQSCLEDLACYDGIGEFNCDDMVQGWYGIVQ